MPLVTYHARDRERWDWDNGATFGNTIHFSGVGENCLKSNVNMSHFVWKSTCHQLTKIRF